MSTISLDFSRKKANDAFAHLKLSPVPIVPRAVTNERCSQISLFFRYPAHAVKENFLFQQDLTRVGDILELTAAALSKHRAGRLDSVGRSHKDSYCAGKGEILLLISIFASTVSPGIAFLMSMIDPFPLAREKPPYAGRSALTVIMASFFFNYLLYRRFQVCQIRRLHHVCI